VPDSQRVHAAKPGKVRKQIVEATTHLGARVAHSLLNLWQDRLLVLVQNRIAAENREAELPVCAKAGTVA
jgi:hypothetical protein